MSFTIKFSMKVSKNEEYVATNCASIINYDPPKCVFAAPPTLGAAYNAPPDPLLNFRGRFVALWGRKEGRGIADFLQLMRGE